MGDDFFLHVEQDEDLGAEGNEDEEEKEKEVEGKEEVLSTIYIYPQKCQDVLQTVGCFCQENGLADLTFTTLLQIEDECLKQNLNHIKPKKILPND